MWGKNVSILVLFMSRAKPEILLDRIFLRWFTASGWLLNVWSTRLIDRLTINNDWHSTMIDTKQRYSTKDWHVCGQFISMNSNWSSISNERVLLVSICHKYLCVSLFVNVSHWWLHLGEPIIHCLGMMFILDSEGEGVGE